MTGPLLLQVARDDRRLGVDEGHPVDEGVLGGDRGVTDAPAQRAGVADRGTTGPPGGEGHDVTGDPLDPRRRLAQSGPLLLGDLDAGRRGGWASPKTS